MKKNFLFKGISILGAVLLFATSVIPTVPVFANAPQPTWYYIHDETSWNAANEDGNPLNKYYEANPYEDLWNPTANRAANFNDKVYDATCYSDLAGTDAISCGDSSSFRAQWDDTDGVQQVIQGTTPYFMPRNPDLNTVYELFTENTLTTSANKFVKFTTFSYPSCTHNWQGAINAPGATYPWVIINFPYDFAGTISLTYNGETKTLKERELIVNGYAIAPIPTLFGEEYKLDTNGKTSFNPANLTVKIIPMKIVSLTENTDWYYVNNEASWNAAYGEVAEKMPLSRYYKAYPYEDLWNPTANRAANFNDKVYDATCYSDLAGIDAISCGDSSSFRAQWDDTDGVQQVIQGTTPYFMPRNPDLNTVYELFTENTLTTSANKFVKFTTFSYPSCTHNWQGSFNAPGAKYPWVVLGQDSQANNTERSGKIAFKYNKDVAYPYGDNDKTINGSYFGTASIPGEFGDNNLKTDVNGDGGTFNKNNFSVVLLNNPGAETTLSQAAHQHTVTFDVNGGSAVTLTQNINCGGVATNQDTTKDGVDFLGWFEEGSETAFDFSTPITEDKTLTAHWGTAIASITKDNVTTNYTSLRAAIAAATDGDTITLVKDDDKSFSDASAEDLYITIDKQITIDGGNDHHYIEGISNGYAVNNWHHFRIMGNNNIVIKNLTIKNFGDTLGQDTNGYTAPIYVHRGYSGKLTLNNVDIESFNSRAIVLGNGHFEIVGGSIVGSNQQYQQAIESYVSTTDNTISGLTISGVKDLDETDAYGIMHAGKGTITVTNTTIEGDRCVTVSSPTAAWAGALDYKESNGKLVLGANNNFNCTKSTLAIVPMGDPEQEDTTSKSTIEVNGGTYEGAIVKDEDASVAGATFKISGGIFSVKPDSSYIVSGKYAKTRSDGKYEIATQSSSSSGGGGGGGSSSYSCKNLPDNAVKNNSKTPTSNTNYSYDTDTTKVCTFQCKSGYTWNSKDAKCEKSDANTNDENKLDETNTNNNEGNNDGGSNNEGGSNGGSTSSNKFSQEMIDAYNFAYKNGITTMDSIEKANMNSPLTRIAMAKMLSQYAINVLGKKPANVVVPNFPDVSAELDASYNYGVTLAYQLGIMGINVENFRPNDYVTRGEFATALSRLLYSTPDGEGAYYETHLAKLMAEGIITNNDPQLQELRGYVMIMLMRSAQ